MSGKQLCNFVTLLLSSKSSRPSRDIRKYRPEQRILPRPKLHETQRNAFLPIDVTAIALSIDPGYYERSTQKQDEEDLFQSGCKRNRGKDGLPAQDLQGKLEFRFMASACVFHESSSEITRHPNSVYYGDFLTETTALHKKTLACVPSHHSPTDVFVHKDLRT
ncbi:hypothetical protein AVEN_223093-1 [Araneus ventricosus]|uniref:Uncharacterized protein n=1 Tax=Araneus ventricosus TaxID=182803 RepID=A0A4Y2G5X2_ARAVE|nr:hypothetical protein AVEN_223093-1 [Araneus ventricosus]